MHGRDNLKLNSQRPTDDRKKGKSDRTASQWQGMGQQAAKPTKDCVENTASNSEASGPESCKRRFESFFPTAILSLNECKAVEAVKLYLRRATVLANITMFYSVHPRHPRRQPAIMEPDAWTTTATQWGTRPEEHRPSWPMKHINLWNALALLS